MIIRYNEYCPLCGTVNPWRKYKSVRVSGERRVYVKCRGCGKNEQIVYRDKTFTPAGVKGAVGAPTSTPKYDTI